MERSKEAFMNQREEETIESALINGQIQSVYKNGKPLSMTIMEQQQEIERLKNWNESLFEIKERHDMEVAAKLRIFEKLQEARQEIDELKSQLLILKSQDNCGNDSIAQENDWDKTHNKK